MILIKCKLNENIKIDMLTELRHPHFGSHRPSLLHEATIETMGYFSGKGLDKEKAAAMRKLTLKNSIIPELDETSLLNQVSKIELGRLIFLDPSLSNQRVSQQQGLFMIPTTLDQKKYQELINKNAVTIRISKKIKNEVKQQLNNMGINTFNLFPDINC